MNEVVLFAIAIASLLLVIFTLWRMIAARLEDNERWTAQQVSSTYDKQAQLHLLNQIKRLADDLGYYGPPQTIVDCALSKVKRLTADLEAARVELVAVHADLGEKVEVIERYKRDTQILEIKAADLEKQIVYEFSEDEVPIFYQGPQHHEILSVVDAIRCNGMIDMIKEMRAAKQES